MSASAPQRPVFVLGPPRSGASLLAWSLGQHSRFRVVAEGGWIGRLSLDLEATYGRARKEQPLLPPGARPAAGNPLLRRCGSAVLEELLPGRRTRGAGNGAAPPPAATPSAAAAPAAPRWVSAHVDHAFCVEGLLGLCPEARFVFVLRDVGSVVRALAEFAAPDGAYYTAESACALWLRSVEACLDAERACGSAVVHRVRFPELADSPEAALRRCLEFLEEPYEAACLRPLRRDGEAPGLPGAGPAPEPVSELRAEAERLSRELLCEPPPRLAPDPRSRERMAQLFRERALRESAGSAVRSPVQQLLEVVRGAVPPGATVLVVSRGDEALLALDGRSGWHFPRAENGLYAGCYPADGAEAIRHLEELRAHGAGFLVFPCTAYWWFSHYPELRRHLEEHYRIVAFQEDCCTVFGLQQPVPGQGPGVSLSNVP